MPQRDHSVLDNGIIARLCSRLQCSRLQGVTLYCPREKSTLCDAAFRQNTLTACYIFYTVYGYPTMSVFHCDKFLAIIRVISTSLWVKSSPMPHWQEQSPSTRADSTAPQRMICSKFINMISIDYALEHCELVTKERIIWRWYSVTRVKCHFRWQTREYTLRLRKASSVKVSRRSSKSWTPTELANSGTSCRRHNQNSDMRRPYSPPLFSSSAPRVT